MKITHAWSCLSSLFRLSEASTPRRLTALCCAVGLSAAASTSLPAQQPKNVESATTVLTTDAFPLQGLSGGKVSPASLQDLINQLNHSRADVRANAASELAWIGKQAKPALPALYRTLSDESPLVRAAAARAVWDIDQQAGTAVPALAELLTATDPGLRTLAAYELGRIGLPAKRALPALTELLAESEGLTRVTVAEAMLKIDARHAPALDALEAALADESSVVRCQAAYALAAVDVSDIPRARSWLRSIAQDDDVAVRTAVAMTLEVMQGAAPEEVAVARQETVPAFEDDEPVVAPGRPVPPMIQELIDQLASDKSVVRKEAAAKLAWLGKDAIAALEPVSQLLVDPDPLVRATAAWAVWEIDGRADEALQVLAPLIVSERPGLPTLAAYILGKMRDDAAPVLPVLQAAMKEARGEFRVIVAEAVAKIDPASTDAVHTLVDGVRDPHNTVRVQAVYALSSVDERHKDLIVSSLYDAAADSDPGVKFAARQALSDWKLPLRPEQTPDAPSPRDVQVATAEEQPALTPVAPIPLQVSANPQPVVPRVAQQPPTPAPSSVEPPEELPADIYASDRVLIRTSRQLTIDIRPRNIERRDVLATGLMPEDPEADPPPTESEDPEAYRRIAETLALRDRLYSAPVLQPPGVDRGWYLTSFYWAPSALCHRPLYFEDVNAERYGIHFGLFQPILSAAHFYGTVPALPYLVAAQCPHECIYTLGYERPGNCVRYRLNCCPCGVKGGLAETAVIWGLIVILY